MNIDDTSETYSTLSTEQALLLWKPKNTVKEKQIQEETVVFVRAYNFGKLQLLCR